MRMRFTALLLSLLAITSGVSADGKGEYKNPKAQKDAQIDRQNSIVVSRDSGVEIFSRSVTYTPATVNTSAQLGYDEVYIKAGATGSGRSNGKLEIYLQSKNYTQAGTGRRADKASSEFEFAWRPFSIIQYVENSKDGAGVPIQNGFDANDTLCNEYQIRPGKSAFTFKFLQSKTVTADNGTAVLNTYEGTHADGVFKLILKATGSETDDPKKIGDKRGKSVWIDNRFVSPTSIKFDIGIDVTKPKFGLNTNGTCGSAYQIAIRSWARSSQELYGRTTTQTTVNGTVVNNKQVTKLQRIQAGGSASPFGFFTWKDTASANYTTTPGGNVTGAGTANVIATNFQKIDNDEDDDEIRSNTKQAIHSFDIQRPTQLLWDPELGADSTDPDVAATTDPTTGGTTSSTGRNDATTTGISVVAMAVAAMVGIFAQ